MKRKKPIGQIRKQEGLNKKVVYWIAGSIAFIIVTVSVLMILDI
jgi:hypothetical protein